MEKVLWQGCETMQVDRRLEVNRKYSVSGYGVLFKLRGADGFFFGSSIFPVVPLPLASEDKTVLAQWVPSPSLQPEGTVTSAGNPQGRWETTDGSGPLHAGRG